VRMRLGRWVADHVVMAIGLVVLAYMFVPIVVVVLASVIVALFFYAASRRIAAGNGMVPGKLQYLGESAYGFVRNGIARDVLGAKDFMKFVPYLVALFFLVLVNNLFGLIPFIQFPTFSRAGFAYGLAALTWILYNGVGIWKHGFLGYLKHQSVPGGVSGPILLLIIPLEFVSNIILRPFSLAIRLFANMMAGHTMLKVFAGFTVLMIGGLGSIGFLAGIVPVAINIALTGFEFLVAFLQAYVFSILTCLYIRDALELH